MNTTAQTPYTDLQAQVRRQREAGIITSLDWQRVFQFSDTAQMNYPSEVAAIARALDELSATPHGQQLFAEIVANPAYSQPVTIISARIGAPVLANFTYLEKGRPLIAFNLQMFGDFFLHPNQTQLTYAYGDLMARVAQLLKASLMHEGDHLARTTLADAQKIFGKDMRLARETSACFEHRAVEREDIQRRFEELQPRRIYRDTDNEFSVLLKDNPALAETLRRTQAVRAIELSDIPAPLRSETEELAMLDQPCTHLDDATLNAAVLKRWQAVIGKSTAAAQER